MAQYFEFESDFVKTMRCIPMQVRYKLDSCGIKLSLKDWSRFTPHERQLLAESAAETREELKNYREHLAALVLERSGVPARELPAAQHPAWLEPSVVPPDVYAKAAELGITLNSDAWARLSSLQRFALIKLARPSHENHNFLPALKEFGLA